MTKFLTQQPFLFIKTKAQDLALKTVLGFDYLEPSDWFSLAFTYLGGYWAVKQKVAYERHRPNVRKFLELRNSQETTCPFEAVAIQQLPQLDLNHSAYVYNQAVRYIQKDYRIALRKLHDLKGLKTIYKAAGCDSGNFCLFNTACVEGRLEIAQWFLSSFKSLQAAECGVKTFGYSARHGQLELDVWLYENFISETARHHWEKKTKTSGPHGKLYLSDYQRTLKIRLNDPNIKSKFYTACEEGHLPVAEWFQRQFPEIITQEVIQKFWYTMLVPQSWMSYGDFVFKPQVILEINQKFSLDFHQDRTRASQICQEICSSRLLPSEKKLEILQFLHEHFNITSYVCEGLSTDDSQFRDNSEIRDWLTATF